jgi:hypothetical protein
MSLLHQCNSCKRTQPNELPIKVEMQLPTLADPPDLEFCSWPCVEVYAKEKRNE